MVVMTHVERANGVTRQTILIRSIHADGSLDGAPRRLGDGIGLDITADRGRYAVAIATSAVPVGFQQFVAYLERDGALSTRDIFPLGLSVWTGARVQLVAGEGGVVATYQRTAYEPLYGGVDRVFLRGGSSEGRGRAVSR